MRFCRVVILLSPGEFGHERNKISYRRGCVLTVCYMSNLWYNIVIAKHIFILHHRWGERSCFVFNLGWFELSPWMRPQVLYFLEIFAKKIKPPFMPTIFIAHLQKKYPSNLLPSHWVCIDLVGIYETNQNVKAARGSDLNRTIQWHKTANKTNVLNMHSVKLILND